ncbi:hypothetical protein PSTT_02972 [Puccinia striiformis]|uniref:Alpha-type protein kinase domain-containing protein n=1 Tax=Puccinia striiformis TaxID=27350 RepID=A0A2S4VY13_9BASI|nr:hypothetical protein PSTT_02972 [Puccinia striiformis]
MPLCKQCKHLTNGPLLLEVCRNCVQAFLATPIPSRLPSVPANEQPAGHQFINPFAPTGSQVSVQRTTSLPQASLNPFHAGDNAHARQLARESRSGKGKEPLKAPKSNTKTITCSLYLYEDGICLQKQGLFPTRVTINLQDPNLYETLTLRLWEELRPSILTLPEIEAVPDDPRPHILLSQGLARIPSQEVLSNIIAELTNRTKLVFDLSYYHPGNPEFLGQQLLPSKRFATVSNSTKRTQGTEKQVPSKRLASVGNSKKRPQQTSLGSSDEAHTRPKKLISTSNASKRAQLVLRVHSSTSGDEVDWITGNRLAFFTTHHLVPDNIGYPSIKFQLSNGIKGITWPITYRVKHNIIIGEGSMRTAYAAEVKTMMADGTEEINRWVAKVCLDDTHPSINQHATDALMYEGFAHLLGKFKGAIQTCAALKLEFKMKSNAIELVRHAVVANGNPSDPKNVYFLEAFLAGPYVKYSSNFDFDVTQNQRGMDNQLFQLMNAFTHWSYNQSKGQRLVSDLQGVGPILTDPQIIDMDPHCWSDGNTSREGINQFVKEHVCHPGNEVCQALQLGTVVDLKWVKRGGIAQLLESRNHNPDVSGFFSEAS